MFSATGAHEQQVTLEYNIQKKISDLKMEFGDIVVRALKWLDQRYPEPIDAVRWLNEVLRGPKCEPLVVPSSSVADNVPLDEQLQKRWSFTNPAILDGLVDKINDEELVKKMKMYNEHFKDVRRSIPINDQQITFEPFDPSNPCLIVKFQNITYFDEIELFLREVFDIHRRYFRVHKIEPGCVKVTLQFDASMEPLLRDLIDKKREAVKHYAEMNIISCTETPATNAAPLESASSAGSETKVTTVQEIPTYQPRKYPKAKRSQSFTRTQSKTYARTKPRKRATTTDAPSSKEIPFRKIPKKVHVIIMQ